MKVKSIVLFVTLAFSILAMASDRVGNGGFVYLWVKDGTPHVYCVDLVEAGKMQLSANVLNDHVGAVEEILKRLKNLDPKRYERLLSLAHTFFAEAEFGNLEIALGVYRSRDWGVINHNASLVRWGVAAPLELAVVQNYYNHPQDKYYFIDEKLWNMMDFYDQVAMILHEIIYRDLLMGPNSQLFGDQETSLAARALNKILISGQSRNFNHDKFMKFKQIWKIGIN